MNGEVQVECERRKPERNIPTHYMWPHFEKELYSICAQRKCTLQSDGKTKNMSENRLMREQFSQNSRKRKDKRIKEESGNESEEIPNKCSDKTACHIRKKSKQNRRLLESVEETCSQNGDGNTSVGNSNNGLVAKKQIQGIQPQICETADPSSVRRQLNYEERENGFSLNQDGCNKSDTDTSTKRAFENETPTTLSSDPESKRHKADCEEQQVTNDVTKDTEQFTCGQLVWGKLKGFDWWPGIVIDFKNVSASVIQLRTNEVWVKWYGDNKYSKLAKTDLVQFRHFADKFLPQKFRGVYKRAVVSALEVAAGRCEKQFAGDVTEADEKASKDERAKLLIEWALDDFKPSGPEMFEDIKDDHKVVINTNTAAVTPDAEWNKTNGKARFGQPIQTPALAEDVKAVFSKAASGIIGIDDICLGCGDLNISVLHPLFRGSLCRECKETFLECVYLFDDDGYQMYCTICGDGKEVFMCESFGCFRSYCAVCLELMCGCGTVEKISSMEKWCCVLCSDVKIGLLQKRGDWQHQLRELFADDKEQEYVMPVICPPIPPENRRAIRVLSLFDGIATGLQALKELGLDVQLYLASEIDEKATQVVSVQHGDEDFVKFVGDIEKITPEQIAQWGPFDLVIGASPCNDLSIANPGRQGIFEGTGRLFFEFFRLLMYAKPALNNPRPFFWLFENVVSMRAVDKRTISRFLQCNPAVVDAKDISPARRARYFWGNLPGMNRPTVPVPGNNLTLQTCLEPNCGRKARFTKIQTVTTNGHSLKQTKEGILPVEVTSPSSNVVSEDVLWCTEMERLFGFPPHYTDVGNMGKIQRQKLLGKAWNVPVVKHLLSPLRDYFSSK